MLFFYIILDIEVAGQVDMFHKMCSRQQVHLATFYAKVCVRICLRYACV
jgi:hypothetical protein